MMTFSRYYHVTEASLWSYHCQGIGQNFRSLSPADSIETVLSHFCFRGRSRHSFDARLFQRARDDVSDALTLIFDTGVQGAVEARITGDVVGPAGRLQFATQARDSSV